MCVCACMCVHVCASEQESKSCVFRAAGNGLGKKDVKKVDGLFEHWHGYFERNLIDDHQNRHAELLAITNMTLHVVKPYIMPCTHVHRQFC